jgi:hypothetical protein
MLSKVENEQLIVLPPRISSRQGSDRISHLVYMTYAPVLFVSFVMTVGSEGRRCCPTHVEDELEEKRMASSDCH